MDFHFHWTTIATQGRGKVMIKTKGMVHFTIPVTDLQRAKAFYCDLVGFDFIRESPRMVFCRSENDYFVLTVSKTPINPNAEGSVSIHHAFYVEPDEFNRAVEYLKDNGVTIAKEETRGPEAAFGGRHCRCRFLSCLLVVDSFLSLTSCPLMTQSGC